MKALSDSEELVEKLVNLGESLDIAPSKNAALFQKGEKERQRQAQELFVKMSVKLKGQVFRRLLSQSSFVLHPVREISG